MYVHTDFKFYIYVCLCCNPADGALNNSHSIKLFAVLIFFRIVTKSEQKKLILNWEIYTCKIAMLTEPQYQSN